MKQQSHHRKKVGIDQNSILAIFFWIMHGRCVANIILQELPPRNEATKPP
jgi:hypothetical protein